MRWFLLLLALVLAPDHARAEPPPGQTLKRVVILQRHGIRAPNLTAAVARYAADPWPVWPVAAGELAPHGVAALQRFGADLRATYAARGLWPAAGCPVAGTIVLHPDNATARTRESAAALAAGLAPDCAVTIDMSAGSRDPLFVGLDQAVCPFDPETARAAMLASVGGNLDNPDPAYRPALAALGDVVAPGACRPGLPCLATGSNVLAIRKGQVRLEGPLADGAALAESLALSYAESLPGAGWGRLDAAKLATLTQVHTIFATLLRRPPYVAAHAAAPLARAILAALGDPGPTRFVGFVGHDVNLANLAAVLGVDWVLPGQPDETAPDTALVFELWRHADGAEVVKLAVRYQTLDALRSAGPSVVLPLAPPGCGEAGCAVDAFTKGLAEKLPPDCP